MTSPAALPDSAPALVVPRHGGGEVLEVRDEPGPEITADQVLIRVAAAGGQLHRCLSTRGHLSDRNTVRARQ